MKWSWLTSPEVLLIELISAVIAIVAGIGPTVRKLVVRRVQTPAIEHAPDILLAQGGYFDGLVPRACPVDLHSCLV